MAVVRRILELTGRDESLIEHVIDRPGHDRRYSLSSEKLRGELGWEPQVRFDDGLRRTVEWYRDNPAWWTPIRSGEYREYYEQQYGRALGREIQPPALLHLDLLDRPRGDLAPAAGRSIASTACFATIRPPSRCAD